jgi:hypothetical protein
VCGNHGAEAVKIGIEVGDYNIHTLIVQELRQKKRRRERRRLFMQELRLSLSG